MLKLVCYDSEVFFLRVKRVCHGHDILDLWAWFLFTEEESVSWRNARMWTDTDQLMSVSPWRRVRREKIWLSDIFWPLTSTRSRRLSQILEHSYTRMDAAWNERKTMGIFPRGSTWNTYFNVLCLSLTWRQTHGSLCTVFKCMFTCTVSPYMYMCIVFRLRPMEWFPLLFIQ